MAAPKNATPKTKKPRESSILGVAVRDVARLREVAGAVVGHGFGEFILRMPFATQLLGRELVRRGKSYQGTPEERFAHLLGELGPTYIKLGQLLSMRSDLLPASTSPHSPAFKMARPKSPSTMCAA